MLAPWKNSYDKPRQCIKKQRHHFADKGLCSQSYSFPVVMYGCESWTMEKAEHKTTDAFELWCLRRLLRDPWAARGSKQSIIKEIKSEYSLEGSYPYMIIGKTIALTMRTFVSKVMSLLFNTLSRFVTAVLPRSKRLLISWLQSPSAVILKPPKIEFTTNKKQ